MSGHVLRKLNFIDQFDEINEYLKHLDEFFDNFFLNDSYFLEKSPIKTNFPFYNSYVIYDKNENPKKLVLEFALAGFSKDEISVEIVEDTLIVKGNKTENKKEDEEKIKYYHQGISQKDFEIKFKKLLNNKLNSEKTNVTFENGILKITIPFKIESVNKKILEIK